MSDLLATLREAKVASEGMIRDRAFPQKDLQQIEQNFSEADREIIWQVGKGERVEAILRSNNALHLVQHAPTPTEPIRFEIRSIPEPANAMRWIVVTLIGLAVFVGRGISMTAEVL